MADEPLFKVEFDLEGFIRGQEELREKATKLAQAAMDDLAASTHNKIAEMAQERLHSRREPYLNALSWNRVNEHTWIITLDPKANWIEDGMCVVYGQNSRVTPKVLTPDGWVKITDVKEGMLVLNQFAKWTPVLKVHDNHLLDFCREIIDEETTYVRFGYNSTELSKRSHKPIVVCCINCGKIREFSKFHLNRNNGDSFCSICRNTRKLVTIDMLVKGTNRRLTLTFDHPVLTQRGWVKAGEINKKDIIFAPKWGSCPGCQEKVPFGEGHCSSSCATRQSNYKRLAAGTHPCQNPEWLANVYKKKIAKGNRPSGVEDAVAGLISKDGYSVGFYKDGDFEWTRQYPVPSSLDRLGRQKYYFLDFYNSKLGLALEIDGEVFHSAERDSIRDAELKKKGIQTIRIPAKKVHKKDFIHSLRAVFANHYGDIEYYPVSTFSVKHFTASESCPLTRRWDITVADGESFVCQGILIHNSPHEMIDGLLKNNAKIARDGSRFKVIPFKQNTAPTRQTQAQKSLTDTIKKTLKDFNKANPDNKIPFGKIEKNPDGSPKLGVLHKLDILSKPLKTHEGPGQGHGAVGSVRQGNTGIPFLKGITISQSMNKSNGKVSRSIMTFRVVSDKQKGSGKWMHPGLEGSKFFPEAHSWALQMWTEKILPELEKAVLSGQ